MFYYTYCLKPKNLNSSVFQRSSPRTKIFDYIEAVETNENTKEGNH